MINTTSLSTAVKSIFLSMSLSVPLVVFADSVEFFNSDTNKKLNLPISDATRVGEMLFLSGQLGNIPGTPELVQGGIGPETRQSLDNIKTILDRLGSSVTKIAKCTVYLVDAADRAEFGKVYRAYFDSPYPARTTVTVQGLALGARVEIECIATLDAFKTYAGDE